jgi:hypothetical protein
MDVTHPSGADSAPDTFAVHAWVDESMKVDRDDRGTYILASVVCDPSCCGAVRDLLCSLLQGKEPRLHWRDEDDRRRTKIAAAVGTLDMAAIVVVGVPMAKRKQERARRLCMETLMPALEALGVSRVFIEARTPSLVTRDREQIANLVGKKLISKDLRVQIARPRDEPMLWVPDAVAGVVGAARAGNAQWLDLMRHTVTELDIELH